MLNTKKLLYILPDVAYVAELLPAKKEHTFSIQSFRQINGTFIDDTNILATPAEKLISKLDTDEYHLILPDFLFTNTIVDVEETTQTKVDQYLENTTLKSIGISKETHQIDHSILTKLNNISRVQLSALEKTVLEPLREPAKKFSVKFSGISSLSWTIKSVVSLEPSITVIQIGTMLYLAQHYIGIDQTTSHSIDDVEAIAETIRTLKGAEPSIQTIYLLSNELVEEQLKENLSDTLPLQQLTKNGDDSADLPSYVKQIIESGMRTLDIPDYPVPIFELGASTGPAEPAAKDEDEDETLESAEDETTIQEIVAGTAVETVEIFEDDEDDIETESSDTTIAEKDDMTADADLPKPSMPESDSDDTDDTDDKVDAEPEKTVATPSTVESIKDDSSEDEDDEPPQEKKQPEPEKPKAPSAAEVTKQQIKQKSSTSSLLKKIFIPVAVFFVTVGIGVGIGLAILQFSEGNTSETVTPTPIEVEPSPSPTPEPSPEPLDVSELSVLVVNATKVAGKAGVIKSDLDDAEFGTVTAGNAKGEYQSGIYVLLPEENQPLLNAIKDATGLAATYDSELSFETEAGSTKYDAVVVFAEE